MKHYHFIGIGGIGMSALCRLALQKGDKAQGSDKAFSYNTDLLQKEGAKIFLGQKEEHLSEGLEVIYSTDIKPENLEFRKAKEMGLILKHRSDLLDEFSRSFKSLFVAGTHGKTTTTSLLSFVLLQGGLDPAFAIGGMLRFSKNARWGKGEYFVLEADESDGSFLKGKPYAAIVTNIEKEHLDYWKEEKNLLEGFRKFFTHVEKKELIFWCKDDPLLEKISPPGISYGYSPHADLQIVESEQEGFGQRFTLLFEKKEYREIRLALIGKHNALNAAAVFGLCLKMGVTENLLRKAFETFPGVGRRMEHVASFQGIDFFDDYAHHPTEIATTLKGFKKAVSPRKVVAVFQPHRYSRVSDLSKEFSSSFTEADLVIVTDIYAAGEKEIPGISGENLYLEIKKKRPAHFLSREKMQEELLHYLKPQDAVITLGAGDITSVGRKYEPIR